MPDERALPSCVCGHSWDAHDGHTISVGEWPRTHCSQGDACRAYYPPREARMVSVEAAVDAEAERWRRHIEVAQVLGELPRAREAAAGEPDPEVIERMARAMYERFHAPAFREDDWDDGNKRFWARIARAAWEAIRG